MEAASTLAAAAQLDSIPELSSLPLSVFERFMLYEDRPDYPMTFYIEMAFEGALNVAALQQSAEVAVRRNLLLMARLNGDGPELHWSIPTAPDIRVLSLNDADLAAPPFAESIDLRTESGLRMWCHTDGASSRIWLQIHHACCDGQGARRFLIELLTGYARLTADYTPLPMYEGLDYDRLLTRGVLPTREVTHRTSAWEKLRNAYGFHCLTPSPLAVPRGTTPAAKQAAATHKPGRSAPAAQPILLSHRFENGELEAFETTARLQDQGSLNDIATSLLFRTIARWNQTHGRASLRQRLRVLVPVDLRDRADARLPSANRLGFSFLSRTVGNSLEYSQVFREVREFMNYVKDANLGIDFLEGIGFMAQYRGALPFVLKMSKCMATAVFTNLDDPWRRYRRRFRDATGEFRIGNLKVRTIVGLPPIRPGMRVGFGLCMSGDFMTLALRADPQYLDAATAQQLLDEYVNEWHQWHATFGSQGADVEGCHSGLNAIQASSRHTLEEDRSDALSDAA